MGEPCDHRSVIGTVIADTYRVLERLDVGVSGELYLIEHAWLGAGGSLPLGNSVLTVAQKS